MPDLFVSPDTKEEPKTVDKPVENSHRDLSFFHAYCSMPTNVTFAHQEPNEQVILLIRRHFFTNFSWLFITCALLILPIGIVYILPFLNVSFSIIPLPLTIIFVSFYYLIVLGYAFLNFVTWFYNVGIITKRRIIDIDFSDIMFRNVAETRMTDIIDVEYNQGGFLHSFFDYGDVFVQTESVKPNFEFHDVPHPGLVVDLILDLKEEAGA